jgi:hypothetical protein
MSDKNKNRRSRLTEFFRYHRNELSGEERNSFERELQKDPFTEEASEGYQSLPKDSAAEDISQLEKRLKMRTSGRRSFMFYRIAASVAILVAVSSVFIILEKSRSSKQVAINTLEPPVLEISRSKPITESEAKAVLPERQVITEKRKSVQHESGAAGGSIKKDSELQQDKSEVNKISSQAVQPEKDDILADRVSEAVVSEIVENRVAAPSTAKARDRSFKKDDLQKEEYLQGHTPPQPVNGKSEFDRYIRENIHHPDSISTGQDEEVSLSFIVRTDGKTDSIRIESSPGKFYSEEAVRLINSGPAWKPAEQSGKPVEERIKLKIFFR